MQALETKKNDERVKAVLAAQRKEKQIAAEDLAGVREEHKKEIAALEEKIKEWEVTNKGTWLQVERQEAEKQEQIKEYKKLKQSYQRFVDRTRGYTAGQADFLI